MGGRYRQGSPHFVPSTSGSLVLTGTFGWGEQRLGSEGVVFGVTQTLKAGHGEYSVAQVGIPGLRHFVYKSRAHVQVTLPRYEDPYDDLQERRRCVLCSAFRWEDEH